MCSISFSECAYIYIHPLRTSVTSSHFCRKLWRAIQSRAGPFWLDLKALERKTSDGTHCLFILGLYWYMFTPKKFAEKFREHIFMSWNVFFSESVFRVVIAGGTIRGVEGRLCRSGALQLQKAIVLSASFSHSVLKSASSSAQLDMLFHLCHLSSERSEPLPRWFSEKSANVTLFIALPYWNVTADKASRMLESPLQRRRSGTASFPKLRPQGLPWRLWSGRCWCWVPQRPTTWSHRVRDRLVSGDVRLHLTSSVSISRLQFFNHENLKNIRIKKMWGEWNSSF